MYLSTLIEGRGIIRIHGGISAMHEDLGVQRRACEVCALDQTEPEVLYLCFLACVSNQRLATEIIEPPAPVPRCVGASIIKTGLRMGESRDSYQSQFQCFVIHLESPLVIL